MTRELRTIRKRAARIARRMGRRLGPMLSEHRAPIVVRNRHFWLALSRPWMVGEQMLAGSYIKRSLQSPMMRMGTNIVRAGAPLLVGLAASVAWCEAPPPAKAPASPCSYSLALWTPAESATQTHQWLQPAARAEGICDVALGMHVWGRTDLYALPGKAAPTDLNPTSVGAAEGWVGVSRPVLGSLGPALFVGVQRPLLGGVQLGLGGVTTSWCGGARATYAGGYAVAGVCTRYAPAEVTQRNAGAAVGGTVVLRLSGAVGLATNFAYVLKTHDRVYAFGPTASWGR